MPTRKINQTLVGSEPAPEREQAIYWDRELKGFGLRLTPTARSFLVERRIQGKTRRHTIGRWPAITVKQARDKAAQLIQRMILDGETPKDLERRSVTLQEAYKGYLEMRKLAPSTVKGYDEVMRLCFSDWQGQAVAKITRNMVIERFRK